MEKYIQGECMTMCPDEEIKMRETQKLLHILEIAPGTEHYRLPRADKNKMVKEFGRSAAGKTHNPKSIRPPSVLLKTVHFLMTEVATNTTIPWNVIYDYIADRLRSIRQDMIIQNTNLAHTITILQPIVRFYAFSAYTLYGCNRSIFDDFLNNKHLLECLKRLLNNYDDFDILIKTKQTEFEEYLLENRPQFEAMYIIFNIGEEAAILRGINLDQKWRTSEVESAIKLSILFSNGNYVKYCRLITHFPPILAALASLHLPKMRRWGFKVMSNAYNSKTLTYPVKKFKTIFLYNSDEEVEQNCGHFGFPVGVNGISLQKQYFKENTENETEKDNKNKPMYEVPFVKPEFIEEKVFDTCLSDLLLYS
ncbi:unnamed protein product [Brassicogethes aeneus]|uniref:SAC3/GANP/THP3 conserved domain-containing protein n=1 Tax=Brassicogethes aeneus TaxID=1431903 RepID=A0A9P0FLL2_BRAAE|nr:unnamed protein product [Brassicogethes aeneus]